MNHQDRELWTYFAALYKNSNKGIKGRGKDRRISNSTASSGSRSMSSSSIATRSTPPSPDFSSLGMMGSTDQTDLIYEDAAYASPPSSDEEEDVAGDFFFADAGFQQRFFPGFGIRA